jgi:hypothetical protein
MRKNHGRRIHADRGFKCLTWMHDRECEAPDGHDLIPDRCMFRIEKQDHKFFMRSSVEVSPEELAHLTRL